MKNQSINTLGPLIDQSRNTLDSKERRTGDDQLNNPNKSWPNDQKNKNNEQKEEELEGEEILHRSGDENKTNIK